MQELTHLLYVSRSTLPLSAEDLNTLAAASAKRNQTVSVTGMLLYSAGSFVQLLEGRSGTLDVLMQRILADSRHTDVQVLLRAPTADRLFRRWYMGVLNLDIDGTPLDRERMKDALSEGPDQSNTGERVLAALRDFRQQLPG